MYYDDTVERYIDVITSIIDKVNIKIIISVNNVCQYKKICKKIKYVEILEPYKEYI